MLSTPQLHCFHRPQGEGVPRPTVQTERIPDTAQSGRGEYIIAHAMESEQCDGREAAFVFEYEQDERTMTELCRVYGIARETGYVWRRRYREQGIAGLVELDRTARRHPNQTPPEMERLVLELRRAHMDCGRES